MISGTTTVLREVREEDSELLGAIRNDLEVQRLLLARPRPNSPKQVSDWIDRLGTDPRAVLFVIG
jgi:RimJ/RimL family protein N-acetyltransferase